MAGVVAIHCIYGLFTGQGIVASNQMLLLMMQPFKFATIGFFLISGFLMEDRLTQRSPLEYMLRRIRTVFAPWSFWFLAFCVAMTARRAALEKFNLHSAHDTVFFIFKISHTLLFTTAYWFVPNLMVALGILMLCRRFLFNPRLGFLFAAMSLFYSLNLYTHWIAAISHPHALFGFVFYLWLGAWTANNRSAFTRWIELIPMPAMIAIVLVAALAALGEGLFLIRLGTDEPANTLRISNQIFSVAMVLLIFRARKPLSPRTINVRATTFGIYLVHVPVMAALMHLVPNAKLNRLASAQPNFSYVVMLCSGLFFFAAIYGCSLTITQWILHYPRLRWMVGNFSLNSHSQGVGEFS